MFVEDIIEEASYIKFKFKKRTNINSKNLVGYLILLIWQCVPRNVAGVFSIFDDVLKKT